MTNTSDKGTFITVHKDAEVIIDHATFQNSYNSGMQSAPLYVNGGKLILMMVFSKEIFCPIPKRLAMLHYLQREIC